MDRVNVAHQHVRAEGNILRRALPAAEYADITHFEVCWLDGMAGDRVVPFLHLLGRGNVYLAITTTNVHFVAMRGIDPTVATLPLSQIDGVEAKGPVPARFFHSHIHGEPDAMRVAKRFEIRARRRRPWQDGPAAPSAAAGETARLESNAAAAAAGASGPVTESDEAAGTATSLRGVGAAANVGAPVAGPGDSNGTAALSETPPGTAPGTPPGTPRDGPTERLIPPYPARVPASPPPAPSASLVSLPQPREFRRRDGDPADPDPTAAALSFDVRSALAEANERALDRITAAVVRASKEAEKKKRDGALLANAGQPASSDALVPEDERDVVFDTETVKLVSVERGSQALYQLECAVVVAHGVKAARDASARDAKRGGKVGGCRLAAAEAAASLAARLPVEHLSCLDDFDAVVAAADDAEGGVAAGPVVLAADMARLVENVARDADGAMAVLEPDPAGGHEAEDEEAHFLPLPGASQSPTSGQKPGASSSAVSSSPSAPGPVAVLAASSDVPSAFMARLERGTCFSAALMPALAVAVASLEAARVRRELEAARDAGERDAESDYAINSARRDLDRERELFFVLERAMLAPKRGVVVGGVGTTAGLVVERVGAFETDDLCAAAAMAEHAKKSRAIRGLALASPKLLDAVARRLSRAVLEATYPHPALRRRRRFRDDKVGFDGVANWARLVLAARQGASAHRAAHLLHWTKHVLSRSEGSPFQRLDIATRESNVLQSITQSAFVFRPRTHAAVRDARQGSSLSGASDAVSETEYAARSAESDASFTRLRRPADGCTEGVVDLVVDVLLECVSVAHHAHLLGGADGWNTQKHAVAHHLVRAVPPRDVRPKVAAMFARLVNVFFDAFAEDPAVGPRGAAAVRAFRCASLLRHLIEGTPDSAVTRCIQDEYDVELRYVFSRRDVYERTTAPGDAFFEKHARPHFNWVMREVCPAFGKEQKETAKAEALALWREEMLARGQQEIEAVEGLAEARAARRGDAGDCADENEAPAGAGDGANEQGADAVAPVKAPEKA